jgi:hypothetical protein
MYYNYLNLREISESQCLRYLKLRETARIALRPKDRIMGGLSFSCCTGIQAIDVVVASSRLVLSFSTHYSVCCICSRSCSSRGRHKCILYRLKSWSGSRGWPFMASFDVQGIGTGTDSAGTEQPQGSRRVR